MVRKVFLVVMFGFFIAGINKNIALAQSKNLKDKTPVAIATKKNKKDCCQA